jgi:hemoglobin-like flavoprotein
VCAGIAAAHCHQSSFDGFGIGSEEGKVMISPRQISLVQQTWQQVLPIRDKAAALFYGRLFELDPSAKSLFKGDLVQQGRRLMDMIDVAVRGLTKLDSLVPALRQMGERHVAYGVKPGHYDTVGAALLWTLGKGLGDGFTVEVKGAWAAVYGVLTATMQQGTSP